MILRFASTALLLSLLVAPMAGAQSADAGAAPATARKASVFPLQPTADEAQAAQLSARFLTRFHYDATPLDAAMSQRIFKAYLHDLDPDKVFFTQQDLDKLAPLRTTLGDAIWNMDLSGPFSIFNLYAERAINRVQYARGLLKQGLDLNTDETYDFDRKNAPWPKDMAELDTLWRKRTTNDWLRLKLAGKSDEEIRKILDKRYANYIDSLKQLDSQDAFNTFMNAYAESTDPHTDYFGPRAAEAFDIQMKLSLDGIGAQLQARDENTVIYELVSGGPAEKSGKLHVGDIIVAVGQGKDGPMVDVVGRRLDYVVSLIRGKKGSVVRLEIIPASAGPEGKHEIITLVRQTVTIEDQAASKKIIDVKDGGVIRKIGVIDLPSFYSDFGARSEGDPHFKSATRDVAKLIKQLKAEGVQGIVMDLRNDGGGSLAEAESLTGLFIGKGPVVQVRQANGEVNVQGSDDPAPLWSGPLVVLVNRGSASASEIFTAAIKDYGRGLVIGQPTFGKGTVQTLIDLDRVAGNDSGTVRFGELKMTIQEFFRINGGSTQLKGVTPDIEFPKNGEEKEFGESTYPNALPWTHIAPADYTPVANQHAYLAQLQAMHDKRVAASPAWKLMLDELAYYKSLRDKTTVSLNFAVREAERKQQDAIRAAFRARHLAIDGSDALLTDEDNAIDDGLVAGERSLKTELKEEADAKKAKDVPQDETAHIVADEISLIDANPALAAQVLPHAASLPAAARSGAAPAASAAPATPASAVAPAQSSGR